MHPNPLATFALAALAVGALGAGCATTPDVPPEEATAQVASGEMIVCGRTSRLGSRIKREECGTLMTEEERQQEREASQDLIRGQQVRSARELGAIYGD